MSDKQQLLESHKANAEASGYCLCPDAELLDSLMEGLAANEDRYGYASCPCRIASGVKEYDSDILCPCEYRDADVNEFGMCYCSLYVSKEVHDDPSKMAPIPERRPVEIQDAAMDGKDAGAHAAVTVKEEVALMRTGGGAGAKPEGGIQVWRCTVCGYLAARESPPPICPICKAKAERFVNFSFR